MTIYKLQPTFAMFPFPQALFFKPIHFQQYSKVQTNYLAILKHKSDGIIEINLNMSYLKQSLAFLRRPQNFAIPHGFDVY